MNTSRVDGVKAPPHFKTPRSRRLVADPAMDTTSPRINPDDVLEAEILPQCGLTHFHGAGHVLPALPADRRALAARSYIIIIRQVDIKHQLPRFRPEVLHGQVISRNAVEDGPNVNFVGLPFRHQRLHLFGARKTLVADVDVVGER